MADHVNSLQMLFVTAIARFYAHYVGRQLPESPSGRLCFSKNQTTWLSQRHRKTLGDLYHAVVKLAAREDANNFFKAVRRLLEEYHKKIQGCGVEATVIKSILQQFIQSATWCREESANDEVQSDVDQFMLLLRPIKPYPELVSDWRQKGAQFTCFEPVSGSGVLCSVQAMAEVSANELKKHLIFSCLLIIERALAPYRYGRRFLNTDSSVSATVFRAFDSLCGVLLGAYQVPLKAESFTVAAIVDGVTGKLFSNTVRISLPQGLGSHRHSMVSQMTQTLMRFISSISPSDSVAESLFVVSRHPANFC